ncbi:MAG: beta-N-acetylhexosaminidase [Planctomycetota bacterium]
MQETTKSQVRINGCDAFRRRVASLFLGGFEGPTLTLEMAELLNGGLRGVVLFARNAGPPDRVRRLTAEVRAEGGAGCLVAVDQEGGRVARLRDGFWVPPAMREFGRAADPGLAFEMGAAVGRQLHGVGVNFNFAPVLDVDTNPANPVIADRALGAERGVVAELGAAIVRGLQSRGVAACGKHFPGHGDTHQDSHRTLPRVEHDENRLKAVEWVPFKQAVSEGVAAVMTAHLVLGRIDPGVPATMSEKILRGTLRDGLGFDGVIVSDDLEMHAIVDRYPIGEAAVRAIAAGVDLVLICHRADRVREAIDTVVAAVRAGRLSTEKVGEAAARVDRLAQRYVWTPDETEAVTGLPVDAELAKRCAGRDRGDGERSAADPTIY